MNETLLHCPFCGTTDPKEIPSYDGEQCKQAVKGPKSWSIICRNPRCGGSTTQARLGWATAAWNNRWVDPSILKCTAGYRFIRRPGLEGY